MDSSPMLGATLDGVLSTLVSMPQLFVPVALILGAIAVLGFPMLGRGPNSSARDPWRGFKYAARATVLDRAGGRCEGAQLVFGVRCDRPATDVDHVFPWSKGGPTVASNGQALCRGHNRSKAAMTPPWWYVRSLERRRRGYFPEGVPVEVRAVMSDDDRSARERWQARRGTR